MLSGEVWTRVPSELSPVILLASASALRCSELLALRLDDLDFYANTIVVEEPATSVLPATSQNAKTKRPTGRSHTRRGRPGNSGA